MKKTHWIGEQFPITQRFAQEDAFTKKTYKSGVHFGVDWGCKEVPLYAPCDGVIADVILNNHSLGNCIFFDDGTHIQRILHLSKIYVSTGDRVICGQQLGVTGNTGMGAAHHLHVDIMKKPFVFANLLSKATVLSTMVDPLAWLNDKGGDLSTYTSKQLLDELYKRL